MAEIRAINDQDLCSKVKKFYHVYYGALDSRRDKLNVLYSASQVPTMTWNGHRVEGLNAIHDFISILPKTDHTITCVNPQWIEVPEHEGWAIVAVMGTVNIEGRNRGFTHNFVLIPENNTLVIHDEQYRFID